MNKTLTLATSIFMSLASLNTFATNNINTEELLTHSDLIFQGKVLKVNYKDSTDGIPHTFVTYAVTDLIAGKSSEEQVTLRFMGGQQKRGEVIRYLHVSDMPDFQEGDSDILFVRRNNRNICPLVKCSQGRFRDVQGLITNDHGQPLLLTEKKAYQLSRHSIADQLGLQKRNKGIGRGITNDSGESQVEERELGSIIDTAGFIADLKQRVRSIQAKGMMAHMSFKSADSKNDFRSPMFRAVKPNQEIASKSSTPIEKHVQGSTFDQREEKQFKENGGDPVIQ